MNGKIDKRPPREQVKRELIANAATKPLNLAVPSVMALTAGFTGMLWLWPLALVVFLALAWTTFTDEREAEQVKQRRARNALSIAGQQDTPSVFAAPIAERVRDAEQLRARIVRDIDGAQLGFSDTAEQMDFLIADVRRVASQAQKIYAFMGDQDKPGLQRRVREARTRVEAGDAAASQLQRALEDQLAAVDAVERKLVLFYQQMDLIVAELGAVHARFMQMSVADEEREQQQLAERVSDLRSQISGVADEMQQISAMQ